MSITVKSITKVNPRNPEAPRMNHFSFKSNGDVSVKEFAKKISDKTTVNVVMLQTVLFAIAAELTDQLSQGKSVHLDPLGSFRISVKSKGVLPGQKLKKSDIKSAKILFRPGIELREMMKSLKYKIEV